MVSSPACLQWRAEQLPGQTLRPTPLPRVMAYLQWRAEQLPGQTAHRYGHYGLAWLPSMEGRAIARPNKTHTAPHHRRTQTFNGGPSNCPAKHVGGLSLTDRSAVPSMEGRAIARPNATRRSSTTTSVRSPSMEGRAIARPNILVDEAGVWLPSDLQWRAEQLPGQTSATVARRKAQLRLQWRAEQLPGQTQCCPGCCRSL